MEYLILFAIASAAFLIDGTVKLDKLLRAEPAKIEFNIRSGDHWSIVIVMSWPILAYTLSYLGWIAILSKLAIIPMISGQGSMLMAGAIINGVTIPLMLLCYLSGNCFAPFVVKKS